MPMPQPSSAPHPRRRSSARRAQARAKLHFLLYFWTGVLVLAGLKWCFPEVASFRWGNSSTAVTPPVPADSVLLTAARNDSLLRAPRRPLQLTDAQGKPVRHRIRSVPTFEGAFPDLNDVQLATASRLGIAECTDRAEAEERSGELVYIGDNPLFEVDPLNHSIPYLVPRAATLLDEIARAFLDSTAMKGIPLHKLHVTSVLRTQSDISKLQKGNGNASSQSCHRFGTTFDIAYNRYRRVQSPTKPPLPGRWDVELKSILAEVLNDLRLQGCCYVKYERHQACFHITTR